MRRGVLAFLVLAALGPALSGVAAGSGAEPPRIVWKDNDDQPVPEPAGNDEGDSVWWDFVRGLTMYPLGEVADLGSLARRIGVELGVVGPRQALNVNALDEVPDSTWFTNRHGRQRMSPEGLARGPADGVPPAEEGPLRIRSGWYEGDDTDDTFGLVVEDREGRRYVLKFDAKELPELTTGTEIPVSRIFYALGWNVPAYHLVRIDPDRLEIVDAAKIKDPYNRKRPMTEKDLERLLDRAHRLPDGRYRVSASQFIAGTPKGPPPLEGVREDDPNDTIPHEDRRDLRGMVVVASWVNYTDAKRAQYYDTFLRDEEIPEGHGHLVHYLLDFAGAFGSNQVDWKPPRYGHEYYFDPPEIFLSLVSLGLRVRPWEKVDLPESPPKGLGYFGGVPFDPEGWKPYLPNPPFDHATLLDRFWGAKLVAAFTRADVRAVIGTGEWSDPAVEKALVRILMERRHRIAEAYFDTRRINPVDRFEVRDDRLRFVDLAVATEVVPPEQARHAWRPPGGKWRAVGTSGVLLRADDGENVLELRTSHDGGRQWSPVTRVSLWRGKDSWRVVGIGRETRRSQPPGW